MAFGTDRSRFVDNSFGGKRYMCTCCVIIIVIIIELWRIRTLVH